MMHLCGWYASMRPRPDAAENRQRPALRPRRHRASMRPRPDAAENQQRSEFAALLLDTLQ